MRARPAPVAADGQRSNAPFRTALGLRISELHPLTVAGNVILPQFYAGHPPYVAGARGDPGSVGMSQPGAPLGSAISAGYFEGLRELAVGQALPMFLRHYYQGAKEK